MENYTKKDLKHAYEMGVSAGKLENLTQKRVLFDEYYNRLVNNKVETPKIAI